MVADGLIIDALNRMSHHSEQLEALLNRMYFASQQEKAVETPGTFRITTTLVLQPSNSASFQLVPNNPRRKRVILINNGPDDLIVNFEPFHHSDVAQFAAILSGTATPTAQVLGGIIAASGPNVPFETTGAVYCYNFVKTGDAVGAAITYIEELYLSNAKSPTSLQGLDGLLHQGYTADGLKSIK